MLVCNGSSDVKKVYTISAYIAFSKAGRATKNI